MLHHLHPPPHGLRVRSKLKEGKGSSFAIVGSRLLFAWLLLQVGERVTGVTVPAKP